MKEATFNSWVGVCRPVSKTLTVFQTKTYDFPSLLQTWLPKSIPYFRLHWKMCTLLEISESFGNSHSIRFMTPRRTPWCPKQCGHAHSAAGLSFSTGTGDRDGNVTIKLRSTWTCEIDMISGSSCHVRLQLGCCQDVSIILRNYHSLSPLVEKMKQ